MVTTSERVMVPAKGQSPTKPEFIRLPKPGTACPWTGLSRSSINQLVLGAKAPVKSVSLRPRGSLRGVRLIHLQSLLDYLYERIEGGAE
jgi:hypothetical protein